MALIKLSQGGCNYKNIVHSASIEKIQDVGQNLNFIISVGYASMINAATYFLVDFLSQIRKIPTCRGKLKHYINRTTEGMKKLDMAFKYEFPNLEVWQKNIYLIDSIYEKIEPICKCIFFSISNELGKKIKKTEDREMLSNMIVSCILLRQATTLFDESMESARRQTGYNYIPYFDMFSARCIEHPFGEAFIMVVDSYGIDALSLTRIQPVRTGVETIINIMGDEKTYMEAKESVENE